MGQPKAHRILDILLEGMVALGAILFLLPIIMIFLNAFKPEKEILQFERLLPRVWTLANFREVLGSGEEIPIGRWALNSLLISSSVTFLVLIVDSLAAFALARLDLPGRRHVLSALVATMMVPGQTLLVPVYLILNRLRWLDTPLAVILPPAAGAFGVFMLHQFYKSIPKELEEAARMDGCSRFQIYRHVILPLSWPAMATLGVFTFMGSWNDFLGPLVFLDSVDRYTLPVGIALFQTSYYNEYGLTLAASLICTAPVLLVFLSFQKQIIPGVALSGLKE